MQRRSTNYFSNGGRIAENCLIETPIKAWFGKTIFEPNAPEILCPNGRANYFWPVNYNNILDTYEETVDRVLSTIGIPCAVIKNTVLNRLVGYYLVKPKGLEAAPNPESMIGYPRDLSNNRPRTNAGTRREEAFAKNLFPETDCVRLSNAETVSPPGCLCW